MEDVSFAGPYLFRALPKIADLDGEKFAKVLDAIHGEDGFERSLGRCEALAVALGGMQAEDVFQLLSALAFLYYRCREWEVESPERPYRESLKEFLRFSGVAKSVNHEELFGRLDKLLAPNPSIEIRRKRRSLGRGLLDNARKFSSFVDLRPRMNSDRSTIEELIPVVLLKIDYEKSDGEDTSFACQVDLVAFKRLQATVAAIERKLSLLRKQGLDSVKIYWDEDAYE